MSENSLVVTVRALLTTMSALQSVITASKSNWLLNTLPLQRVTANTSLLQHVPSASKFLDVVVLLVSLFLFNLFSREPVRLAVKTHTEDSVS